MSRLLLAAVLALLSAVPAFADPAPPDAILVLTTKTRIYTAAGTQVGGVSRWSYPTVLPYGICVDHLMEQAHHMTRLMRMPETPTVTAQGSLYWEDSAGSSVQADCEPLINR